MPVPPSLLGSYASPSTVAWVIYQKYINGLPLYRQENFFDAIPKGKQRDISISAVQGVEYCDKLFAYERHFKEKGYAYKFRMLFTEIVSKPVAIGIEEEAKAYLDSIDDLRLTKRENMTDEQKNSFFARLYPDNEPNSAFKLEDMCFAILRRIECKRELKDVGEDSTNS